ncbi:MAG TPA: hypothetical protein DCR93_33405 [Cytophagales bacterium]|nr:hypothetical protein [Cytophagales bacterium]HAP64176.1 hypothetical protein [Cytophagales bacterium]
MTATGTFGERLQNLLDHEDLSRNAVATKTGISYNTLKHPLETPGAILSIDHLLTLLRTFPHWNPQYLLAGQGPQFRERLSALETEAPSPRERSQYWLEKRVRVREEMAHIRGEAWGPYVDELQGLVLELLEENDAGWDWLQRQVRR